MKLQAEARNFIKKETLAQVFPVNFANKNTFFTEHLQATASTASTFRKNGVDIGIILTILIRYPNNGNHLLQIKLLQRFLTVSLVCDGNLCFSNCLKDDLHMKINVNVYFFIYSFNSF